MTSPQATNSDIVADLEATSIEEKPRIPGLEPDLTADPEREPYSEQAQQELEQVKDSSSPQDNNEDVAIKQGSEEQASEAPGASGDATIPEGQELSLAEDHRQHQYNASMMAGMESMGLGGGPIQNLLAASQGYADPMFPFVNVPYMMDGLPAPGPDMSGMLPPVDGNQLYLDPSPVIHDAVEETRIQAYARLEFEDGNFYMNTYSVQLGRDLAAHRDAIRREEQARQLSEGNPQTPSQERKIQKSVVSESGGFLGDEHNPEAERELRRQQKKSRASKASKKSKSSSSSSQHHSRKNSEIQPIKGPVEYQAQSQVKRSGLNAAGAVPLDPDTLRPSPYHCPLIGIHPGADAPASSYKNISRKHVKIKFNQKKHIWEAHFTGRNGGFVNDEFLPCGAVVALTSGAIMQVGGVTIRFVLPDVAVGETGAEEMSESENAGAERYMEGGKEMSYEFEAAHGAQLQDTSEEESEGGMREQEEEEEGGEEERDEGEEEQEEVDGQSDGAESSEGDGPREVGHEDEEEELDGHSGHSLQADEQDGANDPLKKPQASPQSNKKRGPGRPPKNGIMSKREIREQKLALKAEEQKAKSQPQSQQKSSKKDVPPEAGKSEKTKNPVGRPRIHPRPDTPEAPREKRKYTKRKPKEPKDGEAKQEGSGEEAVKEKKDKKPPKPPRSPSPTFNEADLAPEQLQKPNANYVQLIHEALSESASGQMSLPQIYRAIMRKYPYFVLKVSTNGWQSSVRHNLSQHHAFEKKERDGKGWMWAIVEGVSIEKEKKRRTPPPPQLPPGHMQAIYPGHPYTMQPHPNGMMGPPPGYYPVPPHHFQPGQPPAYMGQPYGNMPPQGHYPPATGPPSGFPVMIPPQLSAPNNPQSYSSPYAPKPPPQSDIPSTGPQPTEQGPPSDEKSRNPPQPPAVMEQPQQPLPVSQSQPQQRLQTQPIQPAQDIHQQSQPRAQNQPPQATQTPGPSQSVQPPQAQEPKAQATQAELLQPQKPPVTQQIHKAQQSSTVCQPEPPIFNDMVMRCITTFEQTIRTQMRLKHEDADDIVTAAVSRVMKRPFQSTGKDTEEHLVKTLSNILNQIAGSDFPTTHNQPTVNPPPSAQTEAHIGTPAGASQPPVKSTGEKVSIARPSFMGTGQNRLNGAVPRPPLGTPGMQRTSSSSQANAGSRTAASSASPAPAPSQGSPNGASTPKQAPSQSPKEPIQLAGQKRPLEDADEMREFKKLSTSGPPQLKI